MCCKHLFIVERCCKWWIDLTEIFNSQSQCRVSTKYRITVLIVGVPRCLLHSWRKQYHKIFLFSELELNAFLVDVSKKIRSIHSVVLFTSLISRLMVLFRGLHAMECLSNVYPTNSPVLWHCNDPVNAVDAHYYFSMRRPQCPSFN